MDTCLQALPNTGLSGSSLLVLATLLLAGGIIAVRTARHGSGRLMAVGLPLIGILTMNAPAPAPPSNQECMPTSTNAPVEWPADWSYVPRATTTTTTVPAGPFCFEGRSVDLIDTQDLSISSINSLLNTTVHLGSFDGTCGGGTDALFHRGRRHK
jgi:hypothetical protein